MDDFGFIILGKDVEYEIPIPFSSSEHFYCFRISVPVARSARSYFE